MYLSQEALDDTFRFIADVSGRGSLIVFDYIHAGVLRRENKYYGEKDIYKTVAKVGEEWTEMDTSGLMQQIGAMPSG